MANRLAAETSPYLRQHADNPVDWWPWGEAAFAEARRLDRPVLLSIGYSACHWCHVMAHECFENDEIASLINSLFVSIKVDREERPDLDAVYMQAVQAISGQGGWPMTVFLTPGQLPFFGGTYFPPTDRQGMRGLPHVLRAAADAYHNRRDAVEHTGQELRGLLEAPVLHSDDEPDPALLDAAAEELVERTDHGLGGFGRAPKFPHAAAVDLLLRRFRATAQPRLWEAASLTLDRMARGGIQDQLAGGFHRYSVDARWAVPHFEKMLYDSAQLVPPYLHAFQLSGQVGFLRTATGALDWMAREMRLPGGGFASALDADTDGVEGLTYVWTGAQLREVLGADAELAAQVWGVTAEGNFDDGATVLSMPKPLSELCRELCVDEEELSTHLEGLRAALLAVRERRAQPARDDKVITSWNALALAAFAEAGAALDRRDYVQVARQNAEFLLRELRDGDGGLLRTWRQGTARIGGFLEDHAYLALALLTLYEASGEVRWFNEALRLCEVMVSRFHDPEAGFFDTPADGETLLVRPRGIDDNPIPAGQSAAALALLRLHAFTGERSWRDVAMTVVRPLARAVARQPLALANLGAALEMAVTPSREVAVSGRHDDPAALELVRVVHSGFHPTQVLAWGGGGTVPLLAGRDLLEGRPAAFVCSGFTCRAPVADPARLREQLATSGVPPH